MKDTTSTKNINPSWMQNILIGGHAPNSGEKFDKRDNEDCSMQETKNISTRPECVYVCGNTRYIMKSTDNLLM